MFTTKQDFIEEHYKKLENSLEEQIKNEKTETEIKKDKRMLSIDEILKREKELWEGKDDNFLSENYKFVYY